jgi:hypothetical protein
MWTLKGRVLECGIHDCVESPEMDRQTDRQRASIAKLNGTVTEYWNYEEKQN